MADYSVGYGKPPRNRRFRPGVSGNPKGRPKRKPTALAEIISAALNGPIDYREQGRAKVAPAITLSLKLLVDRAIAGDLDAAEMVLKIRASAERFDVSTVEPIIVSDWLPDYPGQTLNGGIGLRANGTECPSYV
jgi:Family of unknown function (DUF5681)